MVWYGNSLFDITEKYIVIAKYLIKYMIMSGDFTKNTQGARCHAATKENAEIYCII